MTTPDGSPIVPDVFSLTPSEDGKFVRLEIKQNGILGPEILGKYVLRHEDALRLAHRLIIVCEFPETYHKLFPDHEREKGQT